MLEGGGKTPILDPQELEDIGYKLVAYPLSLLGVSIQAMQVICLFFLSLFQGGINKNYGFTYQQIKLLSVQFVISHEVVDLMSVPYKYY